MPRHIIPGFFFGSGIWFWSDHCSAYSLRSLYGLTMIRSKPNALAEKKPWYYLPRHPSRTRLRRIIRQKRRAQVIFKAETCIESVFGSIFSFILLLDSITGLFWTLFFPTQKQFQVLYLGLKNSTKKSLRMHSTMWHLYTTTQSHIFYRFLFGGTYYGQCVTNQMFFSLICKPNIIKNWFEKSKNAILYSDFGQVQDHSYKAE